MVAQVAAGGAGGTVGDLGAGSAHKSPWSPSPALGRRRAVAVATVQPNFSGPQLPTPEDAEGRRHLPELGGSLEIISPSFSMQAAFAITGPDPSQKALGSPLLSPGLPSSE